MKVIIAGGRDFIVGPKQRVWLDGIADAHGGVELVISGAAPGADAGGEEWAKRRKIPVKRFPADWSQGPSAGPKRNRQMAEYLASVESCETRMCILFPGGKGTASMKRCAMDYNIFTVEYIDKETGK
jgi:hypothetical protein